MVEYKIIVRHVADGPHAHNSHQKPDTVKRPEVIRWQVNHSIPVSQLKVQMQVLPYTTPVQVSDYEE